MSSKSNSSNNNSDSSQATSTKPSKQSKKTGSLYNCEVCKITVTSKNRESHDNGKKHRNNQKKLQRKESGKQQADKNHSTISEEKSKNCVNNSVSCKTNDRLSISNNKHTRFEENLPKKVSQRPLTTPPANSNKSIIPPETSCRPKEQSAGSDQVNSNMSYHSNRNVLQNRYRWESGSDSRNRPVEIPHHAYRGRGHYDGFRQPHRGNFRNSNNRNFGWQESANWNNVEGDNFFHPPQIPEPRHFSRPFPDVNPHDDNPFLMDFENSYDAFNYNENLHPFNKKMFPANCNPETHDNLQGSTPANEKRDTTIEPSTNDAQDKAKSQKAKPIKRSAQSVRAILATRSSVDSDDTLDASGDKREKRNSVSENTTGKKIAQWINPSNPKDEAEVRRLVTQFSKSKKKENLLKLKQQSESRTETRGSDEVSTNFEMDKSTQDSPKETCVQTPSTSIQSTTLKSRKRTISNSESVSDLESSNSLNSRKRTISNSESVSDLESSNSRRSITKSSSTKASQQAIVSSLQSESSLDESSCEKKKRKSSTEKSSSKAKKFTNTQDLEACLDAVAKGNYDTPIVSEASVNSTKTLPLPEKSVPEKIVPFVKKEPVDTIENSDIQNFADSLNLDEFLQNQVSMDNNCSPEATMTPVESLINLFASGTVKVKKEFDDPVIDAIRTVDPAVLDRVCGSQSTTSTKKSLAEPTAGKPPPSVTGSLKAILKQLQKISDREQKVKEKLQEADKKINEYQILLDEWKTKKIKFQSEEEYLGHQRNTLVKSMNDLVTEECPLPNIQEDSDHIDSTSCNTLSKTPSNHSNLVNTMEVLSANNLITLSTNSNIEQRKPTSQNTVQNIPVQNNIQSLEEDIAILPILCTESKKEVPVIDLDEADSSEDNHISTSNEILLHENTLNVKLSEWKVLAAHQVVVNSIQVFEDFLYTSSNDNTAKRFNLKDLSETVIYYHEKSKVTLLCVEKINGMTVVFTACAAHNVVSAFKAEDGTFLNSFKFDRNVASLCKGKDKIYVGLRDGYIFTCNQKEQKEIVHIGEPIRSIALTYQGCISVLVILAVSGSVSIRDADRNGLLIRTVKPQKNLPLFMNVDGDSIYLSGSGVLMGIDIGTARCVQHFDLTAPYTSLTVYQGNIFTTSYSGLVRCHSKGKEKDITVYYGAGNTALTCINVYNGWVFTGNRFGAVDVFKFDPDTYLPCQLGKCDLIFSREKDLEMHALQGRDHDLPSAGSKCPWRTCRVKIPQSSSIEVIKIHLKEHIQASTFQAHFAL